MEKRAKSGRGIDLNMQKAWMYAIETEDKLRLQWFQKNQPRLEALINKENLKKVPQETKDELKQGIKSCFEDVPRHTTPAFEEIPPIVDPDAVYNIMKPVDKNVRNLLYAPSTQKDGRIKYLTERYKLIPEEKFYFPETTSFNYGWNMWEYTKGLSGSKFARQQVIKESFYRRRAGVESDPDWYKEPAKLSPTVCGCI